MQTLSQIQNKYVLPEVVSYSDYINSGYEALMRRQKEAKKQQKQQAKLSASESPGHTHMCVEIKLADLGQFEHKYSDQGQVHCFMIFEP